MAQMHFLFLNALTQQKYPHQNQSNCYCGGCAEGLDMHPAPRAPAGTSSVVAMSARQVGVSQRDGVVQNHFPWAQKRAINSEKGVRGEGEMEHNGSDLLAVTTHSPWQHLKAAVKCQLVVVLRRVMRAPDPGARLGTGAQWGGHPTSFFSLGP